MIYVGLPTANGQTKVDMQALVLGNILMLNITLSIYYDIHSRGAQLTQLCT